ncbi:hypothetical protein FLJC2902T_07340 [Flavobacterium limnosediminis JC2902]|uniref:DUF4595 domain-containing protein n=1 Tax=Flavobacterium limnosediminis JC2902 TaxID=1341181 RepID=V6SRK9_9FLAO|nr:hypothetical protein [Flavobacterium limnosediminis]ESU29338.1 hypothetical protein FLJC2902T_07340 [Flavobacterium limnosediminis JC2902]
MRKLIYAFSALALLFASCSSESDGDSGSSVPNGGSLVKRAVANGNTFEYSYSGNKIVSIKALNQLRAFAYTGNLITKMYISQNNNPQIDYEVKYVYDTYQRLIEETSFNHLDLTATKKIFTHNSDRTISYQNYSGDFTNQNIVGRNGVYHMNANGEVFKKEEFYQGNLSFRQEYTYDSKNNIFINIIGFGKLLTFEGGMFNNILTSHYYDSTNTLVSGFSNQYVYNSDDFPISMTTTATNSSSTYTTQYFYE